MSQGIPKRSDTQIGDSPLSQRLARQEVRRRISTAHRCFKKPGSAWRDAGYRHLASAARLTRIMLRAHALGFGDYIPTRWFSILSDAKATRRVV